MMSDHVVQFPGDPVPLLRGGLIPQRVRHRAAGLVPLGHHLAALPWGSPRHSGDHDDERYQPGQRGVVAGYGLIAFTANGAATSADHAARYRTATW